MTCVPLRLVLGLLAVTCLLLGPGAALAAAAAPTVMTGGASAVTPTDATVSGTVDLNGASLSMGLGNSCYFQYGTSTGAENTQVACTPTPSATGATTVSAKLPGLSGATTYHYNLVVVTGGLQGVGSTTTTGTDASFTTPSATVPPTAGAGAATAIIGTGATLNGAVNAENWSISSCSFTLTPSGGAAQQVPCPSTPTGTTAQPVAAKVSNLAEGTAYTYTLSATYTTSGGTSSTVNSGPISFTTPSANVTAPTNLTPTSVTLNGTVNPQGLTVSACTFFYGTSAPTLKTIPCTLSADQITGTAPISVNANVTGLSPRTTYYDTVVLTTDGGYTAAAGGSFVTPAIPPPPSATTRSASGLGTTTATVNATVNPEGQAVEACEFEYGIDPFPSTTTTGGDLALTEPCQSKPAADGEQTVTATLNDLAPGTRYYVRVLLLTVGGYVIANTETFHTAAIASRPGVRILGVSASATTGRLRIGFMHTGPAPTRGYRCALAPVRHGRVGALRYRVCRSPAIYRHLARGTYVFSVRAGNANGFGPPVSRRVSA